MIIPRRAARRLSFYGEEASGESGTDLSWLSGVGQAVGGIAGLVGSLVASGNQSWAQVEAMKLQSNAQIQIAEAQARAAALAANAQSAFALPSLGIKAETIKTVAYVAGGVGGLAALAWMIAKLGGK